MNFYVLFLSLLVYVSCFAMQNSEEFNPNAFNSEEFLNFDDAVQEPVTSNDPMVNVPLSLLIHLISQVEVNVTSNSTPETTQEQSISTAEKPQLKKKRQQEQPKYPYNCECPVCGQKFTHVTNMIRHRYSHDKERCVCWICNTELRTLRLKTSHMRNKHAVCAACGKEGNPDDLQEHYKKCNKRTLYYRTGRPQFN